MNPADDIEKTLKEVRSHLKVSFDEGIKRLNELLQERSDLENKINVMRNFLVDLAPLCGLHDAEDPVSLLGLTDAVRYVFCAAGKPLSIADVKDALIRKRYDTSGNFNAALATVIKRLHEYGELYRAKEIKDTPAWRWSGKGKRPDLPIPDWMRKAYPKEFGETKEKATTPERKISFDD